jgi:hypothetical protein
MKALQKAIKSVLTVSEDGGRGFVVATERHRYVITAAHCLPRLPVPHPWATADRTYPDLIGPLGKKPYAWAECVFVDPVADIAVLGEPDGQELFEQWKAFVELVNAAIVLPIARTLPENGSQGYLLSLDGEWFSRRVNCSGVGDPGLWIEDASKGIVGGMSGSPILNAQGVAIGMVSCSGGKPDEIPTAGGPQPRLCYDLPAWFVRLARPRRFARP